MTVFDHIAHWQSAFASTLIEILTFGVVLSAFVYWGLLPRKREWSPPVFYSLSRPTLLQELFSQGLLNSKAY